MRSRWIRHALRLLGVGFFGFILYHYDAPRTLSGLANPRPGYLAWALLGLVVMVWLRTERWVYVVRSHGVQTSFFRGMVVFFSSHFLGVITPGRVGDFVKVLYLRADGVSSTRGFMMCLLDRVFDMVIVSACGAMAWLYFARLVVLGPHSVVWPVLVGGGLAILFGISLLSRSVRAVILQGFKRLLGSERYRRWMDHAHELYLELRAQPYRFFGMVGWWTFSFWIVYLLVIFAVCQAVHLDLSAPVTSLFFFASTTVVLLLPISIAGVGTRDITNIVLFQAAGLPAESAVVFSLVMLLMYLSLAVVGFICWMIRPIPLAEVRGAMPAAGPVGQKTKEYQ